MMVDVSSHGDRVRVCRIDGAERKGRDIGVPGLARRRPQEAEVMMTLGSGRALDSDEGASLTLEAGGGVLIRGRPRPEVEADTEASRVPNEDEALCMLERS
jgi:co-chaperonin GroES (HSP10)